MELLGRLSPAPAQDITRFGNGAYALIGGDELNDRGNVSGREWGSGVIEAEATLLRLIELARPLDHSTCQIVIRDLRNLGILFRLDQMRIHTL
ncbi:hypothetical protein KBY82_12665 [Cyanobium sp. AMD-g]|uniref:hypothetical protein n=1 Tax=Cyanobium sp. AMD-g TaxID=2823699 RepID=UPI0020CC6182|nr:hypothetical protein [Cyanobium sp. AMD-g]MCP9931632.1 hypothetical protein [Cyanobium sp. AMD-g]